MKKLKSDKVKLVETVLKGNRNAAINEASLIKRYKSISFVTFFERDDGLFDKGNKEGIFTREEIERDFKNPILFMESKPLKTSEH
jgi:hypothetical protein